MGKGSGTRRYSMFAAAMLGMLLAVACTKGDEPAPDGPAPALPAADPAAPAPDSSGSITYSARHVQDLWVYGRISAIKDDGEQVDLTHALVSRLTDAPTERVELLDGLVFEVHDALDPRIISPAGAARTDLEVVAGVVDEEGVRSLAILATPKASSEASVRFGDVLDIDFTRVEDLLRPGDVMMFDYTFIQGHGAGGELAEAASGLALLRDRFEAGQATYLAAHVDGAPEMMMYSGVLGEAVAGSVRANKPAKEEDFKRSIGRGLGKCRGGGPGCVRKVQGSIQDGARSSTCQQFSNGGLAGPDYCNNPPRPDPENNQCSGTNCGSAYTDPHLRTFDGQRFGMQAVGEFTAVLSDDFEVQIRTRASSPTTSLITAAAIGFGDHRVTLDVEQPPAERIRLDGDPVSIDQVLRQPIELEDAVVRAVGHDLIVEVDDIRVVVNRMGAGKFINVLVDLGDDPVDVRGLLGTANDDSRDDFVTRDGRQLAASISPEEIYEHFVPGWRISQEDSLFDYAPGTGTHIYTDLSMPRHHDPFHGVSDDDRNRAEAICMAAGLINQDVLEACIVDYANTGDLDFVRSALAADANALIADGVIAADQPVDQPAETQALPGQGGITAEVDAPESVQAGSTVEIAWTGPANAYDFVAIARPDQHGNRSVSRRPLSPDTGIVSLRVPGEPGTYQVRYVLASGYHVIASREIEVTAAAATLDAPERVQAGSTVEVAWTGPANAYDFVAIARPDQHGNRAVSRRPLNPDTGTVSLRAPGEPGTYQVRYVLASGHHVIASRGIEVTE